MLTAVIVDDEIPVLNLLKIFLEKTKQINIIETFSNPNAALKNIPHIKPDIVFLDIEMPEINGLELANKLLEFDDNLMVVFITGYNQYAVEAFEVNALDYILKPVNLSRIEKCISKLAKIKSSRNNNTSKNNLTNSTICCFGNFEIYDRNGLIKWPTRKVKEMLAYFIFNRDVHISSSKLGEILWPEWNPEKVRSNFDTTLFRLRKTINEHNLPIEIDSKEFGRGFYRCRLNGIQCDFMEFRDFISKDISINEKNINDYEKICNLYKDDLFSKENYEWCEPEREYFNRCYLNILRNIATFYINNNLYNEALDKLLSIQAKALFDEDTHKQILKLYSLQNNKGLLIKHHEDFKIKLYTELGIKPQKDTTIFFKKLLDKL